MTQNETYPNLFSKKIEEILKIAAQKEANKWNEDDEHKYDIYETVYGQALLELKELRKQINQYGKKEKYQNF
jgi:hypothetical protein